MEAWIRCEVNAVFLVGLVAVEMRIESPPGIGLLHLVRGAVG